MVPCFVALNIASYPVKVTGLLPFMAAFMLTAFFTSDSFVLIVTLILGSLLLETSEFSSSTKSVKGFDSYQYIISRGLDVSIYASYGIIIT